MASHKVVLKPSVETDLHSLPKTAIQHVLARIGALANDPFPRQSAELSGTENLYRLRAGDYRIVYGVDSETKRIIVHYVRHRREAYRGL